MDREPLPIISVGGSTLAALFVGALLTIDQTPKLLSSGLFWAGLAGGAVAVGPLANLVFVRLWERFFGGYLNVGLPRWFEFKGQLNREDSQGEIDQLTHGGRLRDEAVNYIRRRSGSCVLIAQANLAVFGGLLGFGLFYGMTMAWGSDIWTHDARDSFHFHEIGVGVYLGVLMLLSLLLAWAYRNTNGELTRYHARVLSSRIRPELNHEVRRFIRWRQEQPLALARRARRPRPRVRLRWFWRQLRVQRRPWGLVWWLLRQPFRPLRPFLPFP